MLERVAATDSRELKLHTVCLVRPFAKLHSYCLVHGINSILRTGNLLVHAPNSLSSSGNAYCASTAILKHIGVVCLVLWAIYSSKSIAAGQWKQNSQFTLINGAHAVLVQGLASHLDL